jgi:hypothetical protein
MYKKKKYQNEKDLEKDLIEQEKLQLKLISDKIKLEEQEKLKKLGNNILFN